MSLVKLIPIGVVTFVNILLIIVVVKSTRKHNKMVLCKSNKSTLISGRLVKNIDNKQIRATAVLISVCFIYIVCQFPEPFLHEGIYKTLFGECSIKTGTYQILAMVVNILEIFSYSTNFFPYCIVGDSFRHILLCMLKCKQSKSEGVCPNNVIRRSVVAPLELAEVSKMEKKSEQL